MNRMRISKKSSDKAAVSSKENLTENDKTVPNKIKKLNRHHNIKLINRPDECPIESTVGRQLKTIDIDNHLNDAIRESIKKQPNVMINKVNESEFGDVFNNQNDLLEKARLVLKIKEREERQFALKLRSISRLKFKIDCPYVDFVYELGYRKYIHLAITKVFSYLNDKDLSAAFCVSNVWNRFVLLQISN